MDKYNKTIDLRKIAMKEIIPINKLPAVFVPKLDSSIICDIHIGYESELLEKGIIVSRKQLKEILKRLELLYSTIRTRKLIINGDIKHRYKKPNKVEKKEIASFFLRITAYYDEVILIKGNHDTFIKPIAKEFGLDFVEYYFEKEILIIHGHKNKEELVKKSKIIVIGHEHPAILIKDNLGHTSKFFAIIYYPTNIKNIIVALPPFSYLSSGYAISARTRKEDLLSEITKNYAIIEEGIPYAIEQSLGTIEMPKLKFLI